MKSDSFRNNRKALAALLLCSSFITGCPLAVMAEGNETNLEVAQQQIKVSGVVKDAMGEPVIGASIQEKGTSNGIITDVNGNFSLSVNQGATLVISYIGFKTQEIPVVAGKILDVTLKEDTEMLEEVVVVGFGTQKKVNLTGSVGIATAKEIESRPVTSATQALQGLVPGLKITTSSGQLEKDMNISVRGTGTIGSGSNSSPLILIDGMVGDINTVNPQDIENISVLKDAAASSIYGSRAPFGVILVTTKRGKEGKVSVNYNNSFRVSSPINMPKSMDSYSFAVMMNYADANRGIKGSYSDETMQKMIDFQNGKFTNGEVGLDAKSETAWQDRWTQGYANTDIWDAMYKDHVFSQEHNISVTGGSEKMSYYASFNYLDQGGLLNFGKENLQRFNTTAKINGTLTKWLKFNYSTRFTRNDICRPTSLTDSYFDGLGRTNWPNMPIYDQNGHLNHDNPRALAEGGQRTQQTDRHYHQAAFIIEPVKNWITNVEFNYSIKEESTKAATLPAYNYDPKGDKIVTNKDSSLKENDQKENYLNLNVYSSYTHTFADKHNFKFMGGFQAEEFKLHYFDVTKYGLYVEDEDFWEFDLTSGLSGKGEEKTTGVNGYS
ncbi:SusC/RagA family TonB-linked outer membrane protein, partial [Bacteroides cellulosilyticus]